MQPAGVHGRAHGTEAPRCHWLHRDRDVEPAASERAPAPALFIGDQLASPGEYREGVTDVFGASARMPSWNWSRNDQLNIRRPGAEGDHMTLERGQLLRSIGNRGTIEWHQYLPRYRRQFIAGRLLRASKSVNPVFSSRLRETIVRRKRDWTIQFG